MIDLAEVVASYGPDEPSRYVAIADHFLALEDRAAAAVALDRAYGLAPDDAALARHRAAILDELAVTEHGLVWRYVPAGTFLMGSLDGDPDERPVHPRTLPAYWITDVPMTWVAFCRLMAWEAPPVGMPTEGPLAGRGGFTTHERNKIRRRYCASGEADEWRRLDTTAYDTKPMIAVNRLEAFALAERLSTTTPGVRYRVPSEAQWEKAARGGLVGKRYAWGDAPPTPDTCDFDRFGDWQLAEPRARPPNGYGLYGMCGGVNEWVADDYDALAYRIAAGRDAPPAVVQPGAALGVLRGGSWTDCAAAVTVSHRTSFMVADRLGDAPNNGFRLVRELDQGSDSRPPR